MKMCLLFLAIWWSAHANSQDTCDIRQYYQDFIKVQRETINGNDFLLKQIQETSRRSCISSFINANTDIAGYLLTNFSNNANQQEILKAQDSVALTELYFAQLAEDKTFDSVMTHWVKVCLEGKRNRDTIDMDDLLNIAVKYFSVLRINDANDYVGKVCVGLNDIKKTEAVRQPFVEAFCFASILKNYQGDTYSMYDAFVRALKELYVVNLGIDKSERLLRAQGAMYMLMRNSLPLQHMLLAEYEARKSALPFVLVKG